MENSQLEKYKDKVLFTILKKIYEKLGGEEDVEVSDLGFNEACVEVMMMVGMGEADSIDIDYLCTMYNENIDELDEDSLVNPLSRPTLHSYSADIDVISYESIRRTYRHKVSSYDIDNVIPMLEEMESNGMISHWDGEEIDYDTFDSSIESTTWDKDSVDLLK